jgi:diacylglycerol kinase (ATP)
LKNKNLLESFNNAANGIIYVIKNERNLKIHLIAAIGVLVTSLFFKLSRLEFMILLFSITLVIVCELFNSAIEIIVDIIVHVYHPKAKAVKDIAAGAVLISAFFSLVVAYFIFFDRIGSELEIGLRRIEKSKIHVTIIALIVTMLIVLIIKALFKKGTPFYGGMPSGHAAISASLTTAIALLTQDIKIVILSIFLALLVMQSRLEAKIHTVLEILAGGLLGCIITLLLFQLF